MIKQKMPIVNTPSQSPEDSASGLLGALKLALNKTLQDLDCCLPAKIINYDRVNNRAVVQPLHKLSTTGGELHSCAYIQGVPVFLIGGVDVFISFDLKPGDLGWIIANDHDISLFLQSYEDSPGNTARMHSFSDAVFFPDLMTDYTLNAEANEAVFQHRQGEVVIAISDKGVRVDCGQQTLRMTSNTITTEATDIKTQAQTITTDCPNITVNGAQLVINSSEMALNTRVNIQGDIALTGYVKLIGNLRVEGNITASGTIQGNVPL